jgi:hypothetical protein
VSLCPQSSYLCWPLALKHAPGTRSGFTVLIALWFTYIHEVFGSWTAQRLGLFLLQLQPLRQKIGIRVTNKIKIRWTRRVTRLRKQYFRKINRIVRRRWKTRLGSIIIQLILEMHLFNVNLILSRTVLYVVNAIDNASVHVIDNYLTVWVSMTSWLIVLYHTVI